MRSKLLNESGAKSYVVVFETGDEVKNGLLEFFRSECLRTCFFQGVGACKSVVLGYFDSKTNEYEKRPINEQVEIMSLAGNITFCNGEPKIHGHIVVGKRDSTACGGHLFEAVVRPTLELYVSASATKLTRSLDDKTNLALIDLD